MIAVHPIENSSMISGIGYDQEVRILRVQFKNGDTWDYRDVPEAIHQRIITAESIGRAFHESIKGKFEGEKISA